MKQQESTLNISPFLPAILIVGDLLVLLSFVAIGRRSHGMSAVDMREGLATALPFVVSWFGISPWFGIYRAKISGVWSKLVPRLFLSWIIAVPVAHMLRAFILGRPIPAGIPPIFVLVSLGYIGFVMLIWRLGYIWWIKRKTAEANSSTGTKL